MAGPEDNDTPFAFAAAPPHLVVAGADDSPFGDAGGPAFGPAIAGAGAPLPPRRPTLARPRGGAGGGGGPLLGGGMRYEEESRELNLMIDDLLLSTDSTLIGAYSLDLLSSSSAPPRPSVPRPKSCSAAGSGGGPGGAAAGAAGAGVGAVGARRVGGGGGGGGSSGLACGDVMMSLRGVLLSAPVNSLDSPFASADSQKLSWAGDPDD